MPQDDEQMIAGDRARHPSGAEVVLEHVGKAWGTVQALSDISCVIPAASFAVLLGPSGCGKTTCLRLIAGLDVATSGRLKIGGTDVTAAAPAARGVAMVFQSYALFPHLSAAENIVFGLRARRVPAAERKRRLAHAAEVLGITALLSRRPAQLSGGQQQRVALGRAIVAEAPVCLMDEPLSNLDAKLRAEMRVEIVALQRRLGITMIYVTHDQTEAMSMADRVILLNQGRIEQDAAPATLYARPATLFAARFIGSPPMNILPLEQHGDAMVVTGTEGPAIGAVSARALYCGIRPEELILAESGLPLRLKRAEYLGSDTVLHCSCGAHNQPVLMRTPGRVELSRGASLHARFADSAIRLFDAETSRCVEGAQTPVEPA